MNLISTGELMNKLNVRSYNTIKAMEIKGTIKPITVGRLKKWDLEEIIKNLKNEK